MAITPQAIKDQEFQVKFRGYDTVEVKAYLDLIAEEFFELLEQVRQQIDEMDVVVAERDALQEQKETLEEEVVTSRGSSEEIRSEYANRDGEVEELQKEIESLKSSIETLEKQIETKTDEVSVAQDQVTLQSSEIESEKEKNISLIGQLDSLIQKNEELRKEELDFKSTLVAAQQFTDEMKRKSEKEAKGIVEKAKAEAERITQETLDELTRYPAEIEKLRKKRNRVREDLETVLKLCLENLDIFQEDQKEEDDLNGLFQSVKLNKEGLVDTDELDSINMNFDLPGTKKEESEETFSMKDEMENLKEDRS